jgi:hypothetical protein
MEPWSLIGDSPHETHLVSFVLNQADGSSSVFKGKDSWERKHSSYLNAVWMRLPTWRSYKDSRCKAWAEQPMIHLQAEARSTVRPFHQNDLWMQLESQCLAAANEASPSFCMTYQVELILVTCTKQKKFVIKVNTFTCI